MPLNKNARAAFKGLLFILWVVVVTALLLEVAVRGWFAVRLADPRVMIFPFGDALMISRETPYAPMPFIQVDEEGFRGTSPRSPLDTRWRVAFLGGSSTFSSECSDGRTWPERLGAHIAEDLGENVTVLNLARVGAPLNTQSELWSEFAPIVKANLVVVTAAYNNAITTLGRPVVDLRPGVASVPHRLLWGRSLVWTWGTTTLQYRKVDPHHVITGDYAKSLRSIVKTARQQGTAVLFNLQPLRHDLSDAKPKFGHSRKFLRMLQVEISASVPAYNELLEIMAEMGKELDVPVADARYTVLDPAVSDDSFIVYLHLTDEGAGRFADGIHASVRALPGGWKALLSRGAEERRRRGAP